MQNDLKIIGLYLRGFFYKYANPSYGILAKGTLLEGELCKRRMLIPHALDSQRLILSLRGERYAKEIIHKLIRPIAYIAVTLYLAKIVVMR